MMVKRGVSAAYPWDKPRPRFLRLTYIIELKWVHQKK
jgi:hypothetical protein